jgi:triphosphoribosyl-dephospho-CoA synthase
MHVVSLFSGFVRQQLVQTMLSVAECVQLACILEATARKPGNVHRFQDFDDLAYPEFLLSAMAAAPIVAESGQMGVGRSVLHAIQATRHFVRTNTNLGMVLLLAPLAAVPRERNLATGVADVLDSLDLADSKAIFEAIRLGRPGSLGNVPQQDVNSEPTLPLKAIMALAKDRDLIAKQYASNYGDVYEVGLPALEHGLSETGKLELAIINCHLCLLAALPDTLIARKRSRALAQEASLRATGVLAQGWPDAPQGRKALADFDAWLRADGHARNPGSTADLVAACLFAALRDGIIQFPFDFY